MEGEKEVVELPGERLDGLKVRCVERNLGREMNVAVRSKDSGVGAEALQKLSAG